MAANGFGLPPPPPLRGLLVIASQLHFSEHPLALHFFLQGSQSLIHIIVANEDLHGGVSPSMGVPVADGRNRPSRVKFSTSPRLCEGDRRRLTKLRRHHIFWPWLC